MLWSEREITSACMSSCPMIDPFVAEQTGKPSYGLSSYGYDMRLGNDFQLLRQPPEGDPQPFVVDPLNWNPQIVEEWHSFSPIDLPPYSFTLARSIERFYIPRRVLAVCVGKSSYARCGLIVNVTPLEPEWQGILTLELSNTTPRPVRVYPGQGICQLLFFEGKSICRTSYADRQGKYQHQTAITPPR